MVVILRQMLPNVTARQMDLLPIPAFNDNYIWRLRAPSGRALIVDPGQAAPVLAAWGNDPPPYAILLTHHHDDHIGGVAKLLEHWPDTPVYAPQDTRLPSGFRHVYGEQMLSIGLWQFRVMTVPGHTRSHIAYAGEGLLFCGDTLFSLGCGRMFEGTAEQMYTSLQRLAALPDATQVCCAHEYTLSNAAFALTIEPGNTALQQRMAQARAQRAAGQPTLPTTLGDERACNPFLRCDVQPVREAVQRRAGQTFTHSSEIFAALRAWKDEFRG